MSRANDAAYGAPHCAPPTPRGTTTRVGTHHLAWASECCGTRAYATPLGLLVGSDSTRIFRVVCEAPPRADICRSKTALWGYDATPVLRAFARETALATATYLDEDAPPIVRQYLKTGDEAIREAARAGALESARATKGPASRAAQIAAAATHPDPTHAASSTTTWHALGATYTFGEAWTFTDRLRDRVFQATYSRANRRLTKLLSAGRRIYGQRQLP